MSFRILLPPSERKQEGGTRHWSLTALSAGETLTEPRHQLITELTTCIANADDPHAAKIFGVGGTHLAHARDITTALSDGLPHGLPAWQRYTGVLLGACAPHTFSRSQHTKAATSIFFVSGLFGLINYRDEIPEYRLKMGAALPHVGNIARFWRPHLTPLITQLAQEHLIVDLLPNEHRQATGLATLTTGTVLRPIFVRSGEPHTPSRQIIGHGAKSLKGNLLRHLITSRSQPQKSVETFRYDNWCFRGWTQPTAHHLVAEFSEVF